MIKYPKGQSSNNNLNNETMTHHIVNDSFSGRGMTLEQEINESNDYYLTHDIAVIYKKPTPIQIVKVDYPKRSRAVIKEAYFRKASTTDYNGVFQGRYVDFEAKETQNKQSFPLKNFHQHQIDHFKNCIKQKGICFVIIKFTSLNRYFVFPASELIKHWDNRDHEVKSISLSEIEKNGVEIESGFKPTIPYLDGLESLIKEMRINK